MMVVTEKGSPGEQAAGAGPGATLACSAPCTSIPLTISHVTLYWHRGREGKQLVSTLGLHLPFLCPTTPYLLSLYRDREGKQLVPHLPALYHSHLTLPTQGQGGKAAGADPGAAPAFLVPHYSISAHTVQRQGGQATGATPLCPVSLPPHFTNTKTRRASSWGQAAGADPYTVLAFLVPRCPISVLPLLYWHGFKEGKQLVLTPALHLPSSYHIYSHFTLLYRDREGKQLVLTPGTTPTFLVPSCSNQGHLVVIQHSPPLDTPAGSFKPKAQGVGIKCLSTLTQHWAPGFGYPLNAEHEYTTANDILRGKGLHKLYASADYCWQYIPETKHKARRLYETGAYIDQYKQVFIYKLNGHILHSNNVTIEEIPMHAFMVSKTQYYTIFWIGLGLGINMGHPHVSQ
ncbi:hypothetical protein EDB85DRAFT_1893549 [Lactarius pseudohatsudake]|nr:hypothetical protein EDB85DRAFT_1893549 [Lactarius pseudohatsudake]